ncbi:MAG: methyltransferase domain-containing protein [Fibrobacteraceae bacterium]|nr:methyltransferase domain-containing protein [Fibrobacteraceae bacterium]
MSEGKQMHHFNMIENAKKRFQSDLLKKEYSKITSDDGQLQEMFRHCKFVDDARYVDVGTGCGYVAFGIAAQNARCRVTGIDIVENILELNNRATAERNAPNVEFRKFDGIDLPFDDRSVTGMFARYSFHHFPDVGKSAAEIDRVLTGDGFFYVTDPLPADGDDADFANEFSRLRPDGHMRYYTESEYDRLFHGIHLEKEHVFYTKVTIPRKLDDRYRELLDETPGSIQEKYNVRLDDEQVRIDVPVGNILYRRKCA